MLQRLFIIIFILTGYFISDSLMAQNVPVVKFSEFEKKLQSKSDTVYIINFWATWCAPCRKELPEFEKAHQTFSGDKVRVLLVSLDFPSQAKNLPGFLTENSITAPVLLLNDPDANAWIDKVDPAWSGALPATLIYKKNNRLFYEKQLTFDDIRNSIQSLNQF